MRILLVDRQQCETSDLASQLGQRGHEVVRCFPHDGDHVCVGVDHPESCPVESLGCDVALIVRDESREPLLREMGAICAVRRHIPVVEASPDVVGPASWSTHSGAAVVDAIERFDSGFRPRLVAAVEAKLADIPAVRRLGLVPTVAVRRLGNDLHMSLTLANEYSRAEEESIVTWAVRALREGDPYAASADVSVRRI